MTWTVFVVVALVVMGLALVALQGVIRRALLRRAVARLMWTVGSDARTREELRESLEQMRRGEGRVLRPKPPEK